ncbi:MAG: twin-arginine translocation signal domain-containing protein [Polyangiaceae bacterium]
MKNGFSRRNFLKSLGIGAAAAAASGIMPGMMKESFAQAAPGAKKAFVFVSLRGGFNALFPSAGSFLTPARFGVATGNVIDLGNGVMPDMGFINGLGSKSANALNFIKTHFAAMGIAHGSTDHGNARNLSYLDNAGASYPLALASAMGGEASIKCAAIGGTFDGNHTAINGVSVQRINDMAATIAALQGGAVGEPVRKVAGTAQVASQKYSQPLIGANPKALVSMKDGHQTLITTLNKAPNPFNFSTIAPAYGMNGTAINGGLMSRMAGVELMVRAGANVIYTDNGGGWDSHGDTQGTAVRNMMTADIVPALSTFIQRMMVDETGYDVTVIITGDFSRSLPGSDHQGNLSTAVFGPSIKVASTGTTNNNVQLPVGTPAFQAQWSHFATMAGVATNPFGPSGSFHAAIKR